MQVFEENERVRWLKSVVGRDLTEGPSAFAHWLKGTLSGVEPGSISVTFEVRKDMANPMGTLHGGVIAAMFDEVMGITTYALNLPVFYPTVSLHVDYFYPARLGETVVVTARAIRQGKTYVHLEAELRNAEGVLLAKSGANFVASSRKVSEEYS